MESRESPRVISDLTWSDVRKARPNSLKESASLTMYEKTREGCLKVRFGFSSKGSMMLATKFCRNLCSSSSIVLNSLRISCFFICASTHSGLHK
uniref:Uncharacterized protein n=1 Tax=Ascaris lumbricoides TaxID=6252 RepID=A0A0M3HXL8_ASCLU